MLDTKLLSKVKSFVFESLKKELSSQIVYHTFKHTKEVVNAAYEIGQAENISENDLEILLLAAWFHDIGFIKSFENHEESSKDIATKYLIEKDFNEAKIAEVCKIIDATKMPQNPKSQLDNIICDADLYHIGTENFREKSNLIRSEWESCSGEIFTDIEWIEQNEDFISNHAYFTNYAFDKLQHQKTQNWLKTKKDLRKAISKKEDADSKSKLKKADLKRKKEKAERPERGIETMYRVTLRNHIKLSDIADTKANILLSVSAIILSIALSTLFPKLDKPDNYYLIYPTLFFIIITVITMIFSILSTRPKVTSGKFTKDDIAKKKVNLLFFGNFNKMPLKDFQDGMQEMMNDRDYLYKSLMKDLYFLGIVLEKKYRLLRIAYNIFMIGIIVSVIAFIVAFEYMKNG